MEVTISWWWILQIIIFIIFIISVYKAIVYKNKKFLFLALLLMVFNIINPIKIEQPTTINQQYQSDIIKQTKPKIVDNSFKQSTNIKGIIKKDLK